MLWQLSRRVRAAAPRQGSSQSAWPALCGGRSGFDRPGASLLSRWVANGVTAPFVLDGPINGECFFAYVKEVLAPTLSEGDIVLVDNLGSHKSPKIRKGVVAKGAELRFLPRYSPDSTRSR